MKNWKVIVATVVIFCTGATTGGLLIKHVQRSYPTAPRRATAASEAHPSATNHPPGTDNAAQPRPPEVLSKHFLQRLDETFHLSQEQHEAIQKIVSEGQNQMRKVIQDSRLEIREALTPPQRLKFDVLIQRRFHHPLFTTNTPPALTAASSQ